METLKKLLKCEAKLLSEADRYAEKYRMSKEEDPMLADYYYSLADLHLQGYMKTKQAIASYLNKHTDMKDVVDVYSMLKGLMDDFYTDIKEKM
jgi:hypothetical protein